jgi:protein-L-isoaspartate(D-aspartate) O-methyltransferase
VISLVGDGSDGATAQGGDSEEERFKMVARQIERRGIHDKRVLQAMRDVPRHEFVPHESRGRAYDDCALPIGFGQTISQPYIVAFTVANLALCAEDRVLEVGAGSGYQSAVISRLVGEVYAIEIIDELVFRASRDLHRLRYDNVLVRRGDGYNGWAERAPFDAIAVAAALDHVPRPLVNQMREGARMVIPIGTAAGQHLVLVEKEREGMRTQALCPVRFVPFVRPGTR